MSKTVSGMATRFVFCALVASAAAMFGAELQTKAKPKATAVPQAKKEAGPVQGFAVAPMVLADEGCARDYVRAFQFDGVEIRKRLADLEAYHCIDSTATGIFAGVSTERKDFAVENGNVAYFRKVTIEYDRQRTESAVGFSSGPGQTIYFGWIPDQDFYAVSPETFDQLLVEKKIPMSIKVGGR